LNEGMPLVEYSAWKQSVGLHHYEQPYSGLRGIVYKLPATILEAGYSAAEDLQVLDVYLDEEVLRKQDGRTFKAGDFISGAPYDKYLSSLTSGQLQILESHYNLEEEIVMALEIGDWELSESGRVEEGTHDWCDTGTGDPPFWFTGGWPVFVSQENCVKYDASVEIPNEDCLGTLLLPAVIEVDGGLVYRPDSCISLCISAGLHCGLQVESEGFGPWSGTCPEQRGRTVTITQTCHSEAEGCDAGVYQDGLNENSAVVSVDSTGKGIVIVLEQWQTVQDTLGPLVDFCYSAEWDQEAIQLSLLSGEIPAQAD